ncbi:hypothetical protein GRI62_05690 [Erythrobacter arachoides]|uniref:Transferrin-binding protein B C-lobe/N-lobe beta barrel domain-containing protein n=1 Tax=Aurantiacibacter arachoides TaxID=1850444 RepID=A0A844ZZF5_9SPHN|nr:hypothetical protein [Aurantiacibacter arachoides]MXO93098.1 hypothetical protein [Aurantiacibacter arachoides]GGD52059.1 hypothetical protein GCM10011411_09870 [Aurantiacibacter arachoides]
MVFRIVTLLAGCAVLAGCGGGGGSSDVPGPVATSSPTPTPGATPYQTFAQQTGNRTYATSCAAGVLKVPGTVVYPATDFGASLAIAYNAGTQLFAINGPNGVNANFGPADLDPAPPASSSAAYSRTLADGFRARFIIGNGAGAGGTLDYVRSAFLAAQTGAGEPLTHYCVLGVPTLITDQPASGSLTFGQIAVSGVALEQVSGGFVTYDIRDSTVSLSANATTGRIAASIRLLGRRVDSGTAAGASTELGTFAGTAALATNATTFSGVLTSTDRTSLQSQIGGWYFGPQGREIGASFTVVAQDAAGRQLYVLGTVVGNR